MKGGDEMSEEKIRSQDVVKQQLIDFLTGKDQAYSAKELMVELSIPEDNILILKHILEDGVDMKIITRTIKKDVPYYSLSKEVTGGD